MRDRASQIRRAPTRRRIVQAVTEVAAEHGYSDLRVCLAPFMGPEAAMQFALEKSDGFTGAA
jgi:hypothetical protein